MKINSGNAISDFLDTAHILGTFKIEGSIEDFVKDNTHEYDIIKYDKSIRTIVVPSYHLKVIQKWMLQKILSKVEVSQDGHAFVKGRSIATNAIAHIHEDDSWLLRIDIKDFFPSITYESVVKIFKDLSYAEEVSESLASLCTKDDKLCQGFSTSPAIANIFMCPIDSEIRCIIDEMDEGFDLTYTRYADDIIISGLKKRGYTKLIREIKSHVYSILQNNKLVVNERKTSLQKKGRKKITGLYIEGDSVKVSNRFIKEFQSEIYYCQKFGVLGHLRYHGKVEISNFKGYMYGKAAFIKMVDSVLGSKLQEQLNEIKW